MYKMSLEHLILDNKETIDNYKDMSKELHNQLEEDVPTSQIWDNLSISKDNNCKGLKHSVCLNS